jgi:hypothetical protein
MPLTTNALERLILTRLNLAPCCSTTSQHSASGLRSWAFGWVSSPRRLDELLTIGSAHDPIKRNPTSCLAQRAFDV